MFGIGFPELIVICIVALIFIGPKKLPDLMRQGGKLFVQLRRTANDVRSTFDQVVHEAEEEMRKSEAEALRQAILADHIKSPKLIEAATTHTESMVDHHDQIDAHHQDPHGEDGEPQGHPEPGHSTNPHETMTHDQHDPHRPEGAQPFQPNLLGNTPPPSSSPKVAETSHSGHGALDHAAKDPGTADAATANSPAKSKDIPLS